MICALDRVLFEKFDRILHSNIIRYWLEANAPKQEQWTDIVKENFDGSDQLQIAS